jgi:CelD/BcsL family acetyltransferase involved in cellulose biosynthesis
MAAEVVRSFRDLESLRDEWQALAAASGCPALDHDWFDACARSFYAESDLRIVTVRDGGRLTGVAPLGIEAAAAGRRIGLLGVSKLYEPSGWLTASDGALEELSDRVLRLSHPLVLQRIPAESPVCALLPAVARGRALMTVRESAPSLGVDIRGPWDEYYAGLSTRITENLPRLRRRAARTFGQVRAVHATPRPNEVGAVLEAFSGVEGSGWKGRQGSALRDRADLRGFFMRYCGSAAADARLHVGSLFFGSELAAMEVSVEAYGRMWQLKIGYNDALSAYYPGLQLTEASIRAAFERGLAGYEFFGVAATWEERWNPETRRYRMVVSYPLSARGMWGACRDVAGAVWRSTNRRAAAALRSRMPAAGQEGRPAV